jgi:hypothetical protein
MAQAPLKVKSKQKPRERVTKKQMNARPAAPRALKPKNKTLAQLAKLSKVYSVTASTEKLISSRVGHLELLTGSRRELEKAEKEKAKKAQAKK